MLLKRTALLFCLLSMLAGCASSQQSVTQETRQDDLTLPATQEEKQVLARNYYEEGMTLFHAGQLLKAEELLLKSLEIDPAVPEVRNNLGVIYLSHLKYKEAKAEFRKAFEQKPDYINARYNYGLANLKAKKYREALKTFKQLSDTEGAPERLELNIGMTYFGLKKPGLAVKYLSKALTKELRNAQIYYCLGVSYYQLRAYVAAEDNLLNAAEIDPTLSYSFYYLATIKQTQNEFSQAAIYWKKFLEYPSDPQWQLTAENNLQICELKFPSTE